MTEFDVPMAYLERYPVQQVGGRMARELRVPAEELADFNAEIVGKIRLLHVYYGEAYHGPRGIGGFR